MFSNRRFLTDVTYKIKTVIPLFFITMKFSHKLRQNENFIPAFKKRQVFESKLSKII